MDLKYTTLFVLSDHSLYSVPDSYVDWFAADGIRLVRVKGEGSPAEVASAAPNADVLLVGSGRYLVNDALLGLLPQCRLVVRMGVGYDNVDVAAATRRGILVSNMPGNIPEDVSDHTIALMLACVRRIGPQDRAMRAGYWAPALAAPIRRLQGQTVGLVGFGRIARKVVKKLSGFELRFLAHDPYLPAEAGAELGVKMVPLEELLREADIVSLHLPATPETRNLFDAWMFGLMKPGAIFINTARGALVDERALLAALREGRLSAAGLDVFQEEPLKPGHPLLACENVVLTPHTAGYSIEGFEEFMTLGHKLVSEFLVQGIVPEWTVNPEVLKSA